MPTMPSRPRSSQLASSALESVNRSDKANWSGAGNRHSRRLRRSAKGWAASVSTEEQKIILMRAHQVPWRTMGEAISVTGTTAKAKYERVIDRLAIIARGAKSAV